MGFTSCSRRQCNIWLPLCTEQKQRNGKMIGKYKHTRTHNIQTERADWFAKQRKKWTNERIKKGSREDARTAIVCVCVTWLNQSIYLSLPPTQYSMEKWHCKVHKYSLFLFRMHKSWSTHELYSRKHCHRQNEENTTKLCVCSRDESSTSWWKALLILIKLIQREEKIPVSDTSPKCGWDF